jgi:hypothetical protein
MLRVGIGVSEGVEEGEGEGESDADEEAEGEGESVADGATNGVASCPTANAATPSTQRNDASLIISRYQPM